MNYELNREPDNIIEEAINEHGVTDFYCLLSGGKDSMSVAHYISKNYPEFFKGCVFSCVGAGSQNTRKFVIKTCHDNNWPLWLVWPKEKERFLNILLKYGFGGRASHRMWMAYLKGHPWREFIKYRYQEGDLKPALISGVRRKESRMRNKTKKYARKHIDKEGRIIFIKPFVDKDGLFITKYLFENNINVTPTYDWFNRSGECYCGCFAKEYELEWIKQFDRFSYDSIMWYKNQIIKYGSDRAKEHLNWGKTDKYPIKKSKLEDLCVESCEANNE